MFNKMSGTTPDLTKSNIEKLKQLFPEIVTDGKIDFEKLEIILGKEIDDTPERYNFTWHGKKEAMQFAQQPSKGTLRPMKGKSKHWDTTDNLYMEGDNLEVLKLLQKSYNNKVKMIYIDPPYNTGHDFVYKDDFKNSVDSYLELTNQKDDEGNKFSSNTESNGRYHTDWLNMMYSRLKLARNLLTEDGVVFISIDDNEVENLKKLCNEIFGENNFLGMFIINSTPNARDYGHIGKMHEYILFYGKNKIRTSTNLLPELNKKFKYSDEVSGFNIHPLYNSNVAFTKNNRPNLYYPFYLNPTKKINGFYEISLERKDSWIEVYPPLSVKDSVQFVWRWGKEKALRFMNREIVGYKTDTGEYRIVQKMRHSEKLIRSMLIDKKYSSRRGTAEVEELMGNKIFSFPKPVSLIKDLIRIGTNESSIILDFFSGSGTTAQATMELNAEDGGHRKFIMVQLPEILDEKKEAYKDGYYTLCDIGEERIRRAGEKVKSDLLEKNNEVGMLSESQMNSDNLDIGFKVFSLDTSNLNEWQANFDDMETNIELLESNFIDGRSEEDVLYEIILKNGLDLTYPTKEIINEGLKIYDVAYGNLFVCLSDKINRDVAHRIAVLREEYGIETSQVVFKDSGFENDTEKLNCYEILKAAGYQETDLLSI